MNTINTDETMDVKQISFQLHHDNRGSLSVIEYNKEVPFIIKRVYYIYNISDPHIRRGFHAHKKLKQVMFCLNGSCKILFNDGKNEKIYLLDDPNIGLYVGPGIWREMYDFTEGSTLMVLASEEYDENDYIRDFDTFIRECRR